MDVSRSTLEHIYADIVNSLGYKTTVGPTDKLKVSRRYAGEPSKLPSARLARAAWRVAGLLTPLDPPPPPPPPPPPRLAPQTYNRGSSNQDARYCTRDSGNPDGGGYHYDDAGRPLAGTADGRSQKDVPGLRPSDEMNGLGPCDPYLSFPPWPAESYER